MLPSIPARIAAELGAREAQVNAAVQLLDEGATVPFIARYRKEVTGGLDDTQLRNLQERLGYLRELEERRASILGSIDEQGKLTAALSKAIGLAETKQQLEDLYLPYKPKRRTKAQIAIEAGLAPLAEALLADPTLHPETVAAAYLKPAFTTEAGENPGVPDVKAALEGARWILLDSFSEDAALLERLRLHLQQQAVLRSQLVPEMEAQGAKFKDYFDYAEAYAKVPPHRALALFRGRNEKVLRLELRLPETLAPEWTSTSRDSAEQMMAAHFGIKDLERPADPWLQESLRLAWRAKLSLQLETQLLTALRARAEEEAINVFARNLKDLLLAAPAGMRCTMGLDPGIRTGVKVAVVDGTGKLLATDTIYPLQPRNDVAGSLAKLASLCARHQVELVAIGNGTGSRETDALVGELMRRQPELKLTKIMISEAGASVYSASALAAREFPDLDVSLRGAVSIARRLQDPLAELVKIEPKAIGVGQYQHDVSQSRLAKSLDAVVEDCVNAVGVDLNTASVPLLSVVSGLTPTLAEAIVGVRDAQGPFASREALLQVPRLGPKTYEQAAGFLRIRGGTNPLDITAVHPEAYPVVERILADLGCDVGALMGQADKVRRLKAEQYTDDRFGVPTVQDILAELERPGRDPRPEFRAPQFHEQVQELKDLQSGMILEGVVTNVTNFGAFVDVGVHQDGLVHISHLAEQFVKDPHQVVKAGDIVKVRVLEIDLPRRRISLSMRLSDTPPKAEQAAAAAPTKPGGERRQQNQQRSKGETQKPQGALAAALNQALTRQGSRHKR